MILGKALSPHLGLNTTLYKSMSSSILMFNTQPKLRNLGSIKGWTMLHNAGRTQPINARTNAGLSVMLTYQSVPQQKMWSVFTGHLFKIEPKILAIPEEEGFCMKERQARKRNTRMTMSQN